MHSLFSGGFGMGAPFYWGGGFALTFIVFMIWSLVWKGLALWHSARRGENIWFIILLIVNTLGILEIIYLFLVIKIKAADLFKIKKEG